MPTDSKTANLISNVGQRLRLNGMLKRFRIWLIISAIMYFVLLVLSRLLAVIPDLFPIYSIGIPIFTGLLVAILWPEKIKNTESAQAIDKFTDSDDLFLTASTLNTSKGQFQTLIHDKAEAQASNINPQKVVPLAWQTPAKTAALILAVLSVSLFIPQLDPFGKEEERAKKKQKEKVLAEARKETEKRLQKLKKEAQIPKDSETAKAELTKIFQQMKKRPPKESVEKLREKRREIARKWTEKKNELKSEKKGIQISNQKFGSSNKEMKKLAKDVKQGNLNSSAKKIKEMMEEAEELAEMEDSEAKKAKAEKLKEQIEDLKDMLNDGVGSESVKAALNRAMEQLEELSEENKQALMDAAKSLQLSERELSRLQKMMDEMQDLQELLQTASNAQQMAQQMQQNGQNGEGEDQDGPPNYESFQEYQDYFNQQQGDGETAQGQGQKVCGTCEGTGKCKGCNGSSKTEDGESCTGCEGSGKCPDCNGSGTQGNCSSCNGSGKGQGGQGQCSGCNGTGMSASSGSGRGTKPGNPGGGGGIPGENEDAETGLKKEKAKSQMQAGRTLMEWKTKGVSERGKVTEQYQEAMKEIREGVDEAITNEKIPPGYHEVIKKYFSSEEE